MCRTCASLYASKTIVHALVILRLDYGNAVLFGIKETLMTKLQMVQNSAARLIARQGKHQHITPVLIKLRWHPVRWRVQYKLLVFVFSALNERTPKYIQDLVKICDQKTVESREPGLVACLVTSS